MWLVATISGSADLDIRMPHPRTDWTCRGERLIRMAVSYPFHASNGVRENWARRPASRRLARALAPEF